MPVEHALSPAWADHARRMLEEIAEHDRRAFELEGRALAERRELELKRRHMGQVIDTLVAVEKLPPTVEPYRLSPDGKKLLGKAVTDGVAS